MSQLHLSNISKSYGSTRALEDVSLDFEQKKIHAIVGDSGCGKTTLLRIICGLLMPDSGTITLDDRDITSMPPEKRHIGLVFQDYALFPHLNAAQNIGYGLPHLSGSQRRAKVQEVLAAIELPHIEKRYPSELSGGQQQRLAIARALAPEPPVILFDEPFSNLDPTRRTQLAATITRLSKQTGTTSLIVTHDLTDVLPISRTITLLKEGKMITQATPQKLLEGSRSDTIKSMLSPKMAQQLFHTL